MEASTFSPFWPPYFKTRFHFVMQKTTNKLISGAPKLNYHWQYIFAFTNKKKKNCACADIFASEHIAMTQRQNECACYADLWFKRESITNPPLQSPNSHLLPQYFFCWIRYVMEEVRRNLSWKRQPYLFWFGLIHAKRKQSMGILKMPPFCRVWLLTGDEHAHSFCRCVHRDNSFIAHARIHELRKAKFMLCSNRTECYSSSERIPRITANQSITQTGVCWLRKYESIKSVRIFKECITAWQGHSLQILQLFES